MDAADRQWPQYGFAAHKGYGTPAHVAALKLHGPCVLHRRSFAPLRTWLAAEDADDARGLVGDDDSSEQAAADRTSFGTFRSWGAAVVGAEVHLS